MRPGQVFGAEMYLVEDEPGSLPITPIPRGTDRWKDLNARTAVERINSRLDVLCL